MSRNELLGNILYDFTLFSLLFFTILFSYLFPNFCKNVWRYIYIKTCVAQKVKNPPAHAGDADSVLGLGRSPGEGNDNPLQYSCLENPMHRGAWRATVQPVTKLSDMTEHAH